MGLLAKLHLSKKDKKDGSDGKESKAAKNAKPKKTQHQYQSEEVEDPDRDVTKVGQAQLVIGDAPTAPGGGRGGFQSNTNYAINAGGQGGTMADQGGGEQLCPSHRQPSMCQEGLFIGSAWAQTLGPGQGNESWGF